jgi:hypothetical protein
VSRAVPTAVSAAVYTEDLRGSAPFGRIPAAGSSFNTTRQTHATFAPRRPVITGTGLATVIGMGR